MEISSPFVRLLFHFVDDFLCCAEEFSLIRSNLFGFAFVSFGLEDRSQKLLVQFILKYVLTKFSSRSFKISSFIFRSFIHLSLFLIMV